jgi:hypothetical protein
MAYHAQKALEDFKPLGARGARGKKISLAADGRGWMQTWAKHMSQARKSSSSKLTKEDKEKLFVWFVPFVDKDSFFFKSKIENLGSGMGSNLYS